MNGKFHETTIFWDNLTVAVPRKRELLRTIYRKLTRRPFEESLMILKRVSGRAVTGNLIAIMGPSGAGKTTFLATLSGRVVPTLGTVKINDQILPREIISKISSYLPQFDVLPTSLTIEEHLRFTNALKTDHNSRQRKFQISKLLFDLGLIDCKDTLIGKLSAGQRKRVSLASELITKPKILFLDEPTTGLDTFSAMQVIQTLRRISLETIVFCTIHQPCMDVYNLFTHILLMAEGRTAYHGSIDDATKFFSSLGYECPVGFDESEYYIKLISPKYPGSSLINFDDDDDDEPPPNECIDKICRAFLQSSLAIIPEITNTSHLEIEPQRKAGCIVQFFWLTWRIWIQNRRTIFVDWISWICYFLSMAMVVTFYTGINPRTQEGVQNARGALYMMSSEISFTVAYSVIYELPGQLLIFQRENSVYDTGPYYCATFLGLIPKATLKALIFTTVLYLVLITQVDFVNYLFYCLATSTAAICGTAYGLVFSSWMDDVDVVTSIMVPIDMIFLLTAGMFYNLRSLPTYLTCFKYFSMFFYLNEALSIIYWSRVDYIDCQTPSDLPCLRNGTEVMFEYGFGNSNFYWDLIGLIILAVSMNLVGYFGLRRRRKLGAIY
ncbi:protein brown isoform X1 [Osmia lignaria lignaria]|uniref:protein brown isoform X1 n=1 Tax=Osmia lignaria lignaria TaxID=1437193 RepID=UPI00402BB72F